MDCLPCQCKPLFKIDWKILFIRGPISNIFAADFMANPVINTGKKIALSLIDCYQGKVILSGRFQHINSCEHLSINSSKNPGENI